MLEIKDLSLNVEGEKGSVEILHNINLTLEDNKFYVFTGPNGGGKSSLAKVIMGIYKPTQGKIFFNGRDITDLDITERAHLGIGYAFQQPPRFKGLTVEKLLQISAGNNKVVDCCNYLYDVGLCVQDYVGREVDNSLSGGELKRIEIATLLARDLKVAIYDEPEAGIDLWSFSKLIETFRNVHARQHGITIIISHQERILNLADEIILLADGTIKQQGSREYMLPLLLGDIERICPRDRMERGEDSVECNR
ncbi:MAG TPA: ATP-binding cassette domain-containing protein [Clostridia bacterium]|nr:ATP-binding cassette domain-containing protein [Clostridia bacterium]